VVRQVEIERIFLDQRSLTAWQKVIQAISIFTWVGVGLAAMAYVSGPREGWLDQARSTSTMTSLWFQPALPWRHDNRFALAGAMVTARGCRLWHSKSSTHHEIIFKVRGGPGGGQTIDLGEAAGRDIGAWLAVMRDYDDGYLPFPAQAGANAAHDADCMKYWLDQLDP